MVAACLLAGCSLIADGGGVPHPSSATLALSPENPRRGDSVVATASGSVDPTGAPLSYRFEWLKGDDLVREQVVASAEDGSAQDSFTQELNKGESWTARVTPVTDDDREGLPTDHEFVVANTPPRIESLALSRYRPVPDETVRARVVGFNDPDGDADASRYIWHLGTRAPIETANPELDLKSLSPAPTSAESLTVEVVPFDGDDENLEAPVSVGPLAILDDVTRWRTLRPSATLGFSLIGFSVTWDEKHRRFVMVTAGGVWEFDPEFEFVELHPAGFEWPFAIMQSIYDGHPGDERILNMGWTQLSAGMSLFELEVANRGNEAWQEIPVQEGGPFGLCNPTYYLDTSSRVLLVYGPCDGADEVWLLDVSQDSEARWLEGSPFKVPGWLRRGTTVAHPTLENHFLTLGGHRNEDGQPAPIQLVEYDFSDITRPSFTFTDLADTLLEAPMGPIAVVDRERGVVLGGLGGLFGGGSVDRVFTYTPSSGTGGGTLEYRATDLFDELDTSIGAWYGKAGWDGDRVLFWPGFTDDPVLPQSLFRLGEIVPPAEGTNYEWRSVFQYRVDAPWLITQAAAAGDHAIATSTEDSQVVFRLDLETAHWAPQTVAPSPPARDFVRGGQDENGGLWVIGGQLSAGGFSDMTPWHYDGGAWSSLVVTGGPPQERIRQVVFDPGCDDDLVVGVFGGIAEESTPLDDTWILTCPPASGSCTWQEVAGVRPLALRDAAAAFDGVDNVVLFGGWSGGSERGTIYTLDACASPQPGWITATVAPDPVHGAPALRSHVMVRMPNTVTPEFVVAAGKQGAPNTHVWHLREIGDNSYAWTRLAPLGTSPVAQLADASAFWDEEQKRLVTIKANEAHELRVRGLPD